MDKMINSYMGLHNHTCYSSASIGTPDALTKVNELIQYGYDLGLEGIAITDHECLSCHIKALNYYEKMQKDRDYVLALGNEAYVIDKTENENIRNGIDYVPYYHFILVALDTEGHKQLRILSSKAWEHAYTFKGLMRRPTYTEDITEIIGNNKGHIIGSTACLGSRLDRLILDWNNTKEKIYKKKIDDFICWCISTFGKENFYLEIQPATSVNEEQLIVNKTMKILAKEFDLKIICTSDSHMKSKESRDFHRALLKSKEAEREVDEFYELCYLMSADEMRNHLRLTYTDEEINQIFLNTKEISKRIKGYNLKHMPIIPEVPKDKMPDFHIEHRYKKYYDKYEYFKWYAIESEAIQDKFFFYEIEEGLKNLIEAKGKKVEDYIARLDVEFKELKGLSEDFDSHMAAYYSSIREFIKIIWQSDSLAMPGRGSSVCFLTCYLLEITQLDPLPYGDYLPFWRHISRQRGSEVPDIDTDSQDNRKHIIAHNLTEYWGRDKVLRVATFSEITSKTAIERSCKGLGYPDEVGGFLKSLIPNERGYTWNLHEVLYGNEEKDRKPVKEFITEIAKYPKLRECALELEGTIINRGEHPAGLIISNEPYVNQIGAMRSPSGTLCTCYDLADTEECGIIKVDALLTSAATKIRACMDLLLEAGIWKWQGSLKATYDKYISPDVIEYDNPKMWGMIKDIYSLFQFDTAVAVNAINKIKPKSLMELSTTNSMLRLMGDGGKETPLEKYERYADKNEWIKDCKEIGLTDEEMSIIDSIGGSSRELFDSQEKVMIGSMKVAGFTLKTANKLRKAVAKKNPKILEETRQLFYKGCEENGTRKVFADYVWNVLFAMSFGYVRNAHVL